MVKMNVSPPVIEQAPAFTAASVAGQPVSLSDYHGRKHVVLVFNRGLL